jgi:hypothetical protein
VHRGPVKAQVHRSNPTAKPIYIYNSEESKKIPDDGRLLPKHVGASI